VLQLPALRIPALAWARSVAVFIRAFTGKLGPSLQTLLILKLPSIAVLARCASEMAAMRQFLYSDIPNFVPNPVWSKDIEPQWLKQAQKAVALARTRSRLCEAKCVHHF
jgi:hypothetical protein